MITFYINLDTAIKRKNKFQGKDFSRFRAFPRDEVPEILDTKMTSMYNYPRPSHLSRCACWLSHTQLLEKIVNEKLSDVLILEDDAILSKNFSKSVSDICSFIDQNQQLNVFAVNLGAGRRWPPGSPDTRRPRNRPISNLSEHVARPNSSDFWEVRTHPHHHITARRPTITLNQLPSI